MDKLKSCPFCGGNAKLNHYIDDDMKRSQVACQKCGTRGENFTISTEYSSDGKAIAFWNRREGDTE